MLRASYLSGKGILFVFKSLGYPVDVYSQVSHIADFKKDLPEVKHSFNQTWSTPLVQSSCN